MSPSVWAWRSGRIKTIRRAADRVLCLLPFEKRFLDEQNVDAVYVGHPKATELTPDYDSRASKDLLGLDAEAPIVGLLPGSRGSEVSRLAPAFADAAALIRAERPDVRFVLPVARPKLAGLIAAAIDAAGIADVTTVAEGESLAAMRAADIALIASGTAVLEAALVGTPSVAAYRVAPFTAWLVRTFRLIQLDHFTIPNLLSEEPLVPEFLQEEASPRNLADAVLGLLNDPARAASIKSSFATLREQLALNADRRAAEAVFELAQRTTPPANA